MSGTARRSDAATAQRLLAERAARTAPELLREAGGSPRDERHAHVGPAPAPHPADLVDDRGGDVRHEPAMAGTIMPAPAVLAAQQRDGALALLARDLRQAPRWAFRDVDALTGPNLPGDLVVVGGLTGNGKSLFLMSQMHAFAAAPVPVPVLYLPFEVEPEVVRLQYAAWILGLPPRDVIRQDWGALPEGAREAVQTTLDEHAEHPALQFVPEKTTDLAGLTRWVRWGVRQFGARVVMIDHLHRMDWGGGRDYRIAVTTGARRLKDLMRDEGVVGIAAAQLTRSGELADALMPPQLARLKESGGIAEESNVVLMVSRCLKRGLPAKWQNMLRMGQLSEQDIEEPGIMTVTCRKHRLDSAAFNRTVRLGVRDGRLYDLPLRDTWRHPGASA